MIAWFGPLFHIGGFGNATRAFVRALDRQGTALRAVNTNLDHRQWLDPGARADVEAVARRRGFAAVEVLHMEPPAYASWGGVAPAARVAHSVFETLGLPATWVAPLNDVDRVLVPSDFHVEAYAAAGVDRARLGVVPFAVDTGFFAPARDDGRAGRLRFLTVSIWDVRKNLERLIDAYRRAFAGHDDVELVVQTSIPAGDGTAGQRQALEALARSGREAVPRVTLQTESLTQEELRALYRSCDVYVSADRNNIWTLPCVEMLSLGKPVITADYARATGWLSDDNPLRLRCATQTEETPAELARLRPLYEGQRWPVLVEGELERALRFAYDEPARCAALAAAGRRYVEQTHSLDVVGRQLLAALQSAPRRLRLRPERVVPAVLGKSSALDSRRRRLGRLLGVGGRRR